jgi:hypothetical protein
MLTKRNEQYGSPDPSDIETTDIENFNGILRERIGRLVRKTMFLETQNKIGMCDSIVPILLELHKRIQKRDFTSNVGRDCGSFVELT